MFSLPAENWWRLFVWLVIGFVIYFAYGRHHSALALKHAAGLAGGGIPAEAVAPQDPPGAPRAN